MRTVSKSATFLATESVNSAPFKRGETEVQIFWQGRAQSSSPILRCTFLARRSAKLIANFSATMVTSLPSFSLSLSLCISLSLSHRMYLTHNIGSASALPIICNGSSPNDCMRFRPCCKSNKIKHDIYSSSRARSIGPQSAKRLASSTNKDSATHLGITFAALSALKKGLVANLSTKR